MMPGDGEREQLADWRSEWWPAQPGVALDGSPGSFAGVRHRCALPTREQIALPVGFGLAQIVEQTGSQAKLSRAEPSRHARGTLADGQEVVFEFFPFRLGTRCRMRVELQSASSDRAQYLAKHI